MPRRTTPEFRSALEAGRVRGALLIEFEFAYVWARFWTGVGELEWRGVKWAGAGNLGGVSTASEGSEVRADNLVFTLVGST